VSIIDCQGKKIHTLRRDIKGDSSQVNLAVCIDAWDDEEDSWSF
jgi:hypothetical protein